MNPILFNNEKSPEELTAGASIDAWDATYLPPEEWAYEIFLDAQKKAVMLPLIKRRYDSVRKVTVPVQTITATTWTSTVAADVTGGSSEQQYDATGIALDPEEYRTYMPMARKSIEEATWGVEADIRNRLTNAGALKLDTEIWTCLDDAALSSGKWQEAGETLAHCHDANNVDYDTALSVDNVIDSIYNIGGTTFGFFEADSAVVTHAMIKELVKLSTFTNAAEFGNREFLQTGKFSYFLGLNWYLSGNIPQDSGSTDCGFIFDSDAFLIGNVPHEFELASELNRETDCWRYFVKLKMDFKVGEPEAASVLYT